MILLLILYFRYLVAYAYSLEEIFMQTGHAYCCFDLQLREDCQHHPLAQYLLIQFGHFVTLKHQYIAANTYLRSDFKCLVAHAATYM